MSRTVLILGARGRFGRHAAAAFAAAGWQVRAGVRPGAASAPGAVAVDAADAESVTAAARGVEVIVNAANPPYPAWTRELPRLTRATLCAARATGAAVLLPGNVYPYGAGMPPVLSERTPFAPTSRKGRLRAEMEAAHREAARDGVQTLLIRAGDFLDDEIAGNWFDSHISVGAAKGKAMYPGPLDRAHAWAFLPDLARAAEALAARRGTLPAFAPFGYAGLALTGAELVALMEQAAGRRLKVKPMPWTALRLASPVWPMAREILEMRYLWDVPHRIDGAALAEILPDHHDTAPAEAVAAALAPRLKIAEAA